MQHTKQRTIEERRTSTYLGVCVYIYIHTYTYVCKHTNDLLSCTGFVAVLVMSFQLFDLRILGLARPSSGQKPRFEGLAKLLGAKLEQS